MAPHPKSQKSIAGFFRGSFLKFLSVLTLGLFGGLNGFWKLDGNTTRREFWQSYVIVPALMAFVAFLIFRLLNVHGFLNPLNYELRRIVLCLLLSPAIFSALIGQIKRLRDMNLPPILAVLNFIFGWGTLGLVLFCGLISSFGGKRQVRPKGF
jgi:Protein of unknown function (DUF805).